MIIIENTVGKTVSEIRNSLYVPIALATSRNPKIWVHVEKERREVAVNTDDDPIRPGMLAYQDYDEGGIDTSDGFDFSDVFEALGL